MLEQMKPITLLLVEDNPGDVRLIQEVFKDANVPSSFMVAYDGDEALTMLKASKNALPDLILLDLNLPKKKGLEVLTEVKTDPELRRIPVIILTTSSADDDILKSYNSYANAYLTKPIELDKFMTIVRHLEEFWLKAVQYPSKASL